MRRLVTERLVLEPVTERNAMVLWRVMQSANLRRFQDVPRIDGDEFVRRVASRPRRFDGRLSGRFEWLIRVQQGQTPIGWVSLRVGDSAGSSAEIGYSLVAGARRNGYATEAARAVTTEAFSAGLNQVDACCVPANTASRRLLEALGFAQTRLQKNGAVLRGKPVDICLYRVTRECWDATRYASSANSIVMPASSNPK